MVFRRFLGGNRPSGASPDPAPIDNPTGAAGGRPTGRPGADPESATVRRIVNELETMPAERARWLAGFAYVLGRAANADLEMTADETRLMEQIVMEHGGVPEAQAVLVVEIAKQQERLVGGTEDYLVTREWATHASEDDRLALFRCCFLVTAVDDSITAEESAVLNEIGQELQVDSASISKIRAEFGDKFEAVRAMRRDAGAS